MNQIIVDTLLAGVQAFLAKSGEEVAKNFGKDCYQKIKDWFKNDKQKLVIAKLENPPVAAETYLELRTVLLESISTEPGFYSHISETINFTPANIFILHQVFSSMNKIKNELETLYDWWIKANGTHKGELDIQIEQLEMRLTQLEQKVLTIACKEYKMRIGRA